MNYLGLAQKLRQITGTAGDGPPDVVGQTGEYLRLVNWVNDAYAEIQNKWLDWKFHWAEGQIVVGPLVAGNPIYAPPADARILNEDSFYIGETKLDYVTFEDYRLVKPQYTGMTPAKPSEFTIRPDGQVIVFPSPDAIYTIDFEYQRGVHALVSGTDAPLIPADYHETIWWRAKMFWAEFEEAGEQYKTALTNFNLAMLRLEAQQLPAQEYGQGRVQGADIVVTPA